MSDQLLLNFSPSQLPLFSDLYEREKPRYFAIYSNLGQYNKDDNVSSDLIGFDCPFDDSPVISAATEQDLVKKIREAYFGNHSKIEEKIRPDIIVNSFAKVKADLYERIFGTKLNTTDLGYSQNRESLEDLWQRESWRWIQNY